VAGRLFVVAVVLGIALGVYVDGLSWLAVAAMFIGLAGESITRASAPR
jgi:hypothetical protein